MKETSLDDLHSRWLKDRPGYKVAYEVLEGEFSAPVDDDHTEEKPRLKRLLQEPSVFE